MVDKKSAEKLMSMFVKMSGYSRWRVLESGYGIKHLEFYDEKTRVSARMCSYPPLAYVKMPSDDVVDVVSVLVELSRRRCEIFIANNAIYWPDMKTVVLMKPYTSLEELLVKADLEDV